MNDEKVSASNLFVYKENALNYLYLRADFRADFEQSFKNFSKSFENFTKIDKRLENYVIQVFIPLLQKYAPTHKTSLGLRVKDLLENDMEKVHHLMKRYANSQEPFSFDDSIARSLIGASSRYITELEKIQKRAIKPYALQ